MKKLLVNTLYSQRDPQWGNILLGNNTSAPFTIFNYGCVITVLAMYLTAIGKTETPATINEKLKSVNGFVNGGDYVWSALTKIYPDITINHQSPRYSTALTSEAVAEMKKLIDNNHALITEVDFNPSRQGEQMHFVLIYGYEDPDNFLICDPWTGTKTTLNVYGDYHISVYGFTAYSATLSEDIPQAPIEPVPGYFKELLAEQNLDFNNESQIRTFWQRAIDYPVVDKSLGDADHEIVTLQQQLVKVKNDLKACQDNQSTYTISLPATETTKEQSNITPALIVPWLTVFLQSVWEKLKKV